MKKSVFKSVLELLKFLLLCIEEELLKEPEASNFSSFLIFRIAFSVYLPPKPQKSTIGISLLNALNLSSFVTPQSVPEEPGSADSTSPDATKKDEKSREKELAANRLPTIAISDTDEETEELHILRKVKQRGRRGSSPLLARRSASDQKESLHKTRSTRSFDFPLSPLKNENVSPATSTPLREAVADDVWQKEVEGGDITPLKEEEGEESEMDIVELEGGGKSDVDSSGERELVTSGSREGQSGQGGHEGGHEHHSIVQGAEISSPQRLHTLSLSSSSSPIAPSPLLERTQAPATAPASPPPSNHLTTLRLSPLEASVPPSGQSSPTQPPHRSRFLTPTPTPILLSELINSPRFYHPREGQDLTGCSFLYRDLMKSLGNSRNFMLTRHFWNQLFISTLTVDRESLGWNEQTVSLYKK